MGDSFQVTGFSLLRLLSERERSKVYLARDTSGALCAVKLKLPHDPAGLTEWAGRVKRLQPLSGQTGLLPILSYGVTDSGWLWKSFPLADNLPGLPPRGDEAGLQQYTLLRASHAQPHKRFGSAAELSAALSRVVSGQRPLNRRRWLLAGAGLAVAGVAGIWLPGLLRAPARVVWRRVRQKGFNVEAWQGHIGTVDWTRGRMYSLAFSHDGLLLQSVDMNQFTVEMKVIPGGPTSLASTILHPQTRELWTIEGSEGHEGEVFVLNLETEKFRSLGGGPYTGRPASVTPYWNSVTQRVGMFGGYGYFAVTNERREFDSTTGRCVQIEPDHDGPGPWRRRLINIPLVPDANRRRIFVVGGLGSPSGKPDLYPQLFRRTPSSLRAKLAG